MEESIKNKLILHRGYKGKYPENSKAAFINAIKDNLPFEIDIRISRDNVPFIIHDDNLDVLFDRTGKIKDLESIELKKATYKEDSSQNLVSLEEFCKILGKEKDYPDVFIHIKDVEDIHETIKVLKKFNIVKNINFFACYDLTFPLIKIIKDNYPEYKVGLSLVENSPYFSKEYFKLADFIWGDEVTFKWINKEKVDFAHKLGKPFYAPSPDLVLDSVLRDNVKGRWKELLEAGVDGIFTDMPDEFIEFSKELLGIIYKK